MPSPRRSLLALAAAGPFAAAPLAAPGGRSAAAAASFPDRPIALVVPSLAGGATDVTARVLAERMGPRLGPAARIVVENRAGGGGSVGAEWVRNRPPDGHTLLLGSASALGTNPAALPRHTPYDPVEDFSPVAVVGSGPVVVVVPAASPWRTARELLDAVRASPGRYTWATAGAGGIGHLTGEYLKVVAGGLRAEHRPYRGGPAVAEALAKGEVDFALEVLAATAAQLREGLSRALAVSSLARHPLFPAIPTLDEAGLRGFDMTTWSALVGPRGMPAAVAAALAGAAGAALAEPETARRLAAAGVDPAPPGTPEATRAFLAAELAKFRDIVARAELRPGR